MTPPVELKLPVANPEPPKSPPAPDRPPDKKPVKDAEPAKKTGSRNTETFDYPAELPPLPANTSHALDKTLKGLITQNLEGEQRKSIGQATMPFLVGAAAEITRPKSAFFSGIYAKIFGGPLGVSIGNFAKDAGDIIGQGAQLQNAAQNLVAAGAAGAIATAILTPSMSIMKRALLGENAWRQAASFMVRKEDGGLLSRIIHGGESRLMKWSMFRENRARRQLLRLSDQNVDVKDLVLGNKGKIEDLIAEGMVAGATAQMMTELGVPLNPREQEKMERLNRAYEMSKKIFDAKIPTAGQKEIYINDTMLGLIRNKERAMWATQTALITGVGIAKSVSMVGLLQAFSSANVLKLWERTADVVVGAGTYIKGLTGAQAAEDFAKFIVRRP